MTPSGLQQVWLNDSLRDAAASDLLANRAFRYGDGLVDTIRMLRGELLFFHDHVERLFHGMQALGIPKPALWDARLLYECVSRVLMANNADSSARIRIQVWRTGDGLYNPANQGAGLLIEATVIPEDYAFNEIGLKAVVATNVIKSIDRIANVKTSSMLPYVLAAQEAAAQNADVGFVMNARNTLADAPGRNVFVIEAGKVVTPPLADGGVAGVFRLQLLELLQAHKIVTREESISAERLGGADEIFVTNVIDGIQPVSLFNGRTYSVLQTKELFKLFRNHLSHRD